MTRPQATAIGFVAVLLWALLALFTVGSAPTPPFLLNTLCFAIGGTLGLIWATATGALPRLRDVPLRVYGFGTLGLFGYHALYFSALRLAPAAEAGLIAYLWPLLIVIFSGLLPGETLKKGHIIGACFGFAGAALIITGGGAGFSAAYAPGYALAVLCALTWSGYSVLSRKVGTAPTASVAVFCLASAALSLPMHLMFEETLLPQTTLGWAAIAGLGLGPVGLAFFVWDIGVKQGDIQLLGTSSYAAPLLSTLVLVIAGVAAPSFTLLWAAALITGGAAIAARASLRQ
ncbi:EamA family transporter [Sulfitobacter mediterraneus]|uniref:aromatic amino acid exporter YddG n=1 Tax=Sulfitobacter mediterraneus TaxID=83219 RepID=UPI00193283AA|nr:EamA family transporter [Sulfitobacter mediterraneus]MBM1310573.1 EamA family transporter [Sulfitobacter mediterraneus]MBM1314457.1 EamA family transporter [Sulfitobacter mediterraneus]MBM1322817.1 EamA family transporter [Sulfitobacter mediterraneus]MBM1326729.1 EamA family transporter [Sulfitobacter mediterraneus]MBM1398075.1 EamA family transporter [Sulfitobacter mediterraneus]